MSSYAEQFLEELYHRKTFQTTYVFILAVTN